MEKKSNTFYTTVTVSDFKDTEYINQLLELNIGMELALLTGLPHQLNMAHYEKDLDALKKEVTEFKNLLDQFNIPPHTVRIHQPGGYAYYWFGENEISGFDLLKDFFAYCYGLEFRNYVIHSPYGNADAEPNVELNDYRKKLNKLISEAHVEVEEISASKNEIKNKGLRSNEGTLIEKLMDGQKAKILLDVHECGGTEETIRRLKNLTSRGFEINSIHMHKDKHKFLTREEVGLLKKTFSGNLINEGFLKNEYSFDEFIKTKSINCVVPNNERLEILKGYIKL